MASRHDAYRQTTAWLTPAALVAVLLAGCNASAGRDIVTAPTSGASATASPSVTATPAAPDRTPPAATPASNLFADVGGTWCSAEDATDCFTIALPRIEFASAPGVDQYVFPAGSPSDDPASWTYADLRPGTDGCYVTVTDGYPAMSGAAFIYCPAGAVPAELIDRIGDDSVDRVFITQEIETIPFYRNAG